MYCSLLLNFLHHVIRLKMILYSPVKIGSVLIIIADLKDFLWLYESVNMWLYIRWLLYYYNIIKPCVILM